MYTPSRSSVAFGVLTVLLCTQQTGAVAGEHDSEVWQETRDWLKSLGAVVHEGLRVNATHHGGANVRGVVTDIPLKSSEVLLEIPEKAMMTPRTYPELNKAAMFKHPGCEDVDVNAFAGAAALAIETKKGPGSKFYQYISQLPSMQDYESFFPRLMKESIIKDFAGMDIVETVRAQQLREHQDYKRCFDSWLQHTTGLMEGLTWDDMKLALMRWLTRSYSDSSGSAALIPAADLLNTGPSKQLNTEWTFTDNSKRFILSVHGSQAVGNELYDSYCPACDNENMLMSWGIYMEDNLNPLSRYHKCPEGEARTRLHKRAEEMLELDDVDGIKSQGWTAPRCRSSAVESFEQGPLRCNLARLAYEQCAQEWVHWQWEPQKTDRADVQDTEDVPTFTSHDVAKLLSKVTRGRVPEELLQDYRFSSVDRAMMLDGRDGQAEALRTSEAPKKQVNEHMATVDFDGSVSIVRSANGLQTQ